ncbi:MAG: molybdopterin molybdotransferase MoeA [Chloroflexi bacterium]|nr:molybdopterin molybdotransferase MoeA [Chloroflexota bacterium]
MSDLLSVEVARGRVLAAVPAPLPAETVPVVAARGRVLAADVVAATDLPPWDNSAMDGYAVRSADVAAATAELPVRLAVRGEAAAGRAPDVAVDAGGAVRIATGAPLPSGADAVVQVEMTTPLDAAGAAGARGRDAAGPPPAAVLVHAAIGPGANVRRLGEDLRAGAVVLRAGRAVGPAEVALVAGAGVPVVAVHRRPRVAVISTGDELRAPGADLGPAGIPDSNGPSLVALAAAAGADARHLGIAPDDLATMTQLLRAAAASADLVVVSGGVSVGPYDVVKPAFEAVGTVDLWRVAVQPGKPFAFGVAPRPAGSDASGPVLLLGLPGNPVSTFVTFELFVRPAIRLLAGRPADDLLRPADRAVLEEPVTKAPGRRAYLRVSARRDGPAGPPLRDAEGRVRVDLAGGQGSHVLSSLAAADALAIVPESVDALPAGAPVELWWLDHP